MGRSYREHMDAFSRIVGEERGSVRSDPDQMIDIICDTDFGPKQLRVRLRAPGQRSAAQKPAYTDSHTPDQNTWRCEFYERCPRPSAYHNSEDLGTPSFQLSVMMIREYVSAMAYSGPMLCGEYESSSSLRENVWLLSEEALASISDWLDAEHAPQL